MTDTEDKEFETAFSEFVSPEAAPANGEPPKEPEDPQAVPEPQADGAGDQPLTQPETTSPDDIWKDPEQAKAAYEAANSKAQELEHKLRSDDGRVSRYQRERDEAIEKLKAASAGPGKEDPAAFLASEEYQKVKADYGDEFAPVFKVLERLAERDKEATERFGQLDETQAESLFKLNQDMLTEKAPDWLALVSRQDFGPWVEAQPSHIQDAFERNREKVVDPEVAADVMSRFRAYAYLKDNPPAPQPQSLDQRRAAQLEGAKSAGARQPVVADTVDEEDFEANFKRFAAAKAR